MKILVFGSLNIDLVFSVDHIVCPGETIGSTALIKSAGGKGANQAAALAKAGMDVYMAGKIGQDGRFLLSLLESYKVHTEYVAVYHGATGQALIQLDKNSRNAIVLYSGGNGAITPDEINKVMAHFDAGDMLVLQNEIAHTKEILEQARKKELSICFNPSPYNQSIEDLPLDAVDIFFVNEIEGAGLVKLPAETPAPPVLDNLVKRFPRAEIILTAGREGAYYGFGSLREKGDIVDMPVVDTTGAGDTFTGFFLAARIKGHTVAESLKIAGTAASIAVSRKGAMESIPFGEEVFRRLPPGLKAWG